MGECLGLGSFDLPSWYRFVRPEVDEFRLVHNAMVLASKHEKQVNHAGCFDKPEPVYTDLRSSSNRSLPVH